MIRFITVRTFRGPPEKIEVAKVAGVLGEDPSRKCTIVLTDGTELQVRHGFFQVRSMLHAAGWKPS